MRNLFACLVHEQQEAVVDLVRNLVYLDPDSSVLLYNGGEDVELLERRFTVDGYEPLVHPSARPQQWGSLHEFALDCMRYGLEEIGFDALTVVDSDQLLLRSGYSACLADFLAQHRAVGMLGGGTGWQPPTTRIPPAASAWQERDRWLPLCRRFPGGEAAFPQWNFWPTTVFSAAACRDLVRSFDEDAELVHLMKATRIFATEEVVLPTLVALHGHAVAQSPWSHEFVRYNVLFTLRQLRAAMGRPDVFWVHPVPRRYDHPLRCTIRASHGEYERAGRQGAVITGREPTPLLLTLPILGRMRAIEGWLSEEEADLLIAGVSRALADLPDIHAVVEVGSYCGRATMVLGSVVKALCQEGRVYAIDTHEGEVGALDQRVVRKPPTLAKFKRNMALAGLSDIVVTLEHRSYEVPWDQQIAFLLVDGLHDFANVSRDFCHFEGWLPDGAYIAFHDYADYYPGVKAFVNELLQTGRYERVHCAATMMLVRRRDGGPGATAHRIEVRETAPKPLPPPAAPDPLVTCVMPTYGRPHLVRRAIAGFLAQDYPHAELVVVDDGQESLASLLPDDPRVRHIRLERRLTIGAKRNLGCEAARGELIANWDDDDWYAPWRLRYQVAALRADAADVAGLARLLYLEPSAERAWRYAWPPSRRPWVHDAVLFFTRELWRRNPFPNANREIDCRFLWTPARKKILALPDERFYVGVIHQGNTSPKNTAHGQWKAHPRSAIDRLMGEDAAFYRHAFGPASWVPA